MSKFDEQIEDAERRVEAKQRVKAAIPVVLAQIRAAQMELSMDGGRGSANRLAQGMIDGFREAEKANMLPSLDRVEEVVRLRDEWQEVADRVLQDRADAEPGRARELKAKLDDASMAIGIRVTAMDPRLDIAHARLKMGHTRRQDLEWDHSHASFHAFKDLLHGPGLRRAETELSRERALEWLVFTREALSEDADDHLLSAALKSLEGELVQFTPPADPNSRWLRGLSLRRYLVIVMHTEPIDVAWGTSGAREESKRVASRNRVEIDSRLLRIARLALKVLAGPVALPEAGVSDAGVTVIAGGTTSQSETREDAESPSGKPSVDPDDPDAAALRHLELKQIALMASEETIDRVTQIQEAREKCSPEDKLRSRIQSLTPSLRTAYREYEAVVAKMPDLDGKFGAVFDWLVKHGDGVNAQKQKRDRKSWMKNIERARRKLELIPTRARAGSSDSGSIIDMAGESTATRDC